MAGLGFLIGGALTGVGQELEDQAKAARDRAMLELEYDYKGKDEQRQADINTKGAAVDHGYKLDEINATGASRDRSSGVEAGYRMKEIGAEGANQLAAIGATQAGDNARQGSAFAHEDAGIVSTTTDDKGQMIGLTRTGKSIPLGIKRGGISDDDKLLLNTVENQFTSKKDILDADGNKTGSETSLDTDKIAKRFMGLGRPDLAKLYNAAPPSTGPAARTLPGTGTSADPFRGTTQTDIDWFKQKAPAGSVIVINGKPYTK